MNGIKIKISFPRETKKQNKERTRNVNKTRTKSADRNNPITKELLKLLQESSKTSDYKALKSPRGMKESNLKAVCSSCHLKVHHA